MLSSICDRHFANCLSDRLKVVLINILIDQIVKELDSPFSPLRLIN